jgi:hypothetical protein
MTTVSIMAAPVGFGWMLINFAKRGWFSIAVDEAGQKSACEKLGSQHLNSVDVGLVVLILSHDGSTYEEASIPARRVVAQSPTNRSPAPHVQASARAQRTTQDKRWDDGSCRSHRLVPAHASRDCAGTCVMRYEDHGAFNIR